MRTNHTMIQTDSNTAKSILESIKGCKVADDSNNVYKVADVKVFNGSVYAIGLKDIDGVIKYCNLNCYMEMASVA